MVESRFLPPEQEKNTKVIIVINAIFKIFFISINRKFFSVTNNYVAAQIPVVASFVDD